MGITASFIHHLNNQMYEASNLSELLPSLIGYQFLKIDYRQIIQVKDFNKTNLTKLKKALLDLLMAFKIDTNPAENSSYSDKQIVKLIKKGTKEENIKMVYDFVKAVERGIGFVVPLVFNQLVTFTRFIDFELFIEVLNAKERTIEIIYLLYQLELSEKERIILNPNISNKWCLYELLRQILGDIRNKDVQEMSDSYYLEISNALSKLAIADSEFFEHFIVSHRTNRHFSKILALSLSELDREYVDIYLNTVKLDTYVHNIENDRLFINTFIDSGNMQNLYYLCQKVFLKWQELLQSILSNEEFINNIVYSNHYFSVLQYIHMEYDEEQLMIVIKQTLEEIEYNSYTWKNSSIDERNHYFIGLTKLYTLGVVFSDKALKWDKYQEVKETIQMYLYDRKLWLRYFEETRMPKIIKDINDFFNIT